MSLPPGCEPTCPGCSHRELSREESEAKKNSWLERELAPWRARLRPLLSPAGRWGYRRKSVLHARVGEDGRFELGMIQRRGREELFTAIPACPVHEPGINELFAAVRACADPALPLVFALASGRAVTVVLKCVRDKGILRALEGWRERFPGGVSLFVCWNPVAGHRVLDARRMELVWGEEWMEAEGLWHGPVAFRQQIPGLDESALRAAEEFLAAGDTRSVIDLYCGLGHSLRRWAARGWAATGVELSGESLAAAARNAPAAKLLRGRVEERLPQLDELAAGWNAYTNPPRLGHDPRVLDWLLARKPERVAYLSCNPRTLARDLAALAAGYEVVELLPFDFFPQTGHVETLALLRRRG